MGAVVSIAKGRATRSRGRELYTLTPLQYATLKANNPP